MKIFLFVFILLTWRNLAFTLGDSLFVQTKGDSTFIWDAKADENCASRFISTVRVSHDTVFATRIDTSSGWARCGCVFNFRFAIVGLAPGVYRAVIHRRYSLHGDSLLFVGTIPFSVATPSGIGLSQIFFQSTCGASLDDITDESVPYQPVAIKLENFPNPFNPETTIEYSMPKSQRVTLQIFDLLGRHITTLEDRLLPAGHYRAHFNGENLSSGAYICRLRVDQGTLCRLLVLAR